MHRDLHSGNILLKEQYEAYITDLGLSISFDEKQDGQIHGVLPYLAPEVLKDNTAKESFSEDTSRSSKAFANDACDLVQLKLAGTNPQSDRASG
ncbi:13218_t:CDS:2 [Ambispora leptoticha]|uniref:13218_t:CDS:1 n=1 Tax=Ambispora leptoticha TaxID=144679 RepID=A0A9N9AXS0_9GLOM|nr:13218_t:CDS:2 [Ambispora leptoticha]